MYLICVAMKPFVTSGMPIFDVIPVARLEAFRALKLSRLESFSLDLNILVEL